MNDPYTVHLGPTVHCTLYLVYVNYILYLECVHYTLYTIHCPVDYTLYLYLYMVVGANTRSFVPLATLKSKVLPIQIAQDTAGSQKCCL